jgi:hypothetical protein
MESSHARLEPQRARWGGTKRGEEEQHCKRGRRRGPPRPPIHQQIGEGGDGDEQEQDQPDDNEAERQDSLYCWRAYHRLTRASSLLNALQIAAGSPPPSPSRRRGSPDHTLPFRRPPPPCLFPGGPRGEESNPPDGWWAEAGSQERPFPRYAVTLRVIALHPLPSRCCRRGVGGAEDEVRPPCASATVSRRAGRSACVMLSSAARTGSLPRW